MSSGWSEVVSGGTQGGRVFVSRRSSGSMTEKEDGPVGRGSWNERVGRKKSRDEVSRE